MKNIYSLLIGILFSVLSFQTIAQLTVSTYNPVQNATNISKDISSFTLTFNQNIKFNSDDSYRIYIKKYSDDSKVAKYWNDEGSPDDELSISGDQFIITDASLNFDYNTKYYITIEADAIQSSDGTYNFGGISSKDTWSFTIESEPTPPSITKYLPETGDTTVNLNDTLKLTFNEKIVLDRGYLNINYSSDSSNFQTLAYNNSNVSIVNDTILCIAHNSFNYDSTYFVNIDSGFVQSYASGTDFPGIKTATEWTFTTKKEPVPPSITKYWPATGDTMVRLTETLKLTFNDTISLNKGTLKIKKLSDNSTKYTFAYDDGNVSIVNDSVLTISHTAFIQDTSYYVVMDTGFVQSATTGADFSGISNSSEWYFKAIKVRDWVGSNSTDWTNSSNWGSNGTFVNGSVVNIPSTATYFPVIASGNTVEIADLIIEAGGGISIASGATVTVDSVIELKSSTSANANLLCNGTLNYDTIDIKIHQNIEVPDRWYYITSPVLNATGNTIGCDGDIWYWDNAEGVWKQATSSDVLEVGKGYTIWSNNSLVFTGKINTEDVTVTLDYGKSVGWNLVGNPYTNSINWNNVGVSSDSIYNGFWLYQNTDDVYGAYNGESLSGTNGIDSIIPSNHNFWVRLDTTVSETITFSAACKSTTAKSYLKNASTNTKYPLFKFAAVNGTKSDEVIVSFSDPNNTPLKKLDMTKKFSSNKEYIQPYFISGKKSLCMKGVANFTSEVTVPFMLKIDTANQSTSFSINKILIENFPDDVAIFLHDKVTDQLIDFRTERVYNFTETSKGDIDRFELIFKGELSTSIDNNIIDNNDIFLISGDKQFTININNNDPADIKIYNLSGQLIGNHNKVYSKKVIGVPVRGMYIVNILQKGKMVTKKVFVK